MKYYVIKYNTMTGSGIAFVEDNIEPELALEFVKTTIKHHNSVRNAVCLGKVNDDELNFDKLTKIIGSEYSKEEYSRYEFWKDRDESEASIHLYNSNISIQFSTLYYSGGDCC